MHQFHQSKFENWKALQSLLTRLSKRSAWNAFWNFLTPNWSKGWCKGDDAIPHRHFCKLNIVQCAGKTLIDAKSKVFGFVAKLNIRWNEVVRRDFTCFHHLQSQSVSEFVQKIISDHLLTIITDFEKRFEDLRTLSDIGWLNRFFAVWRPYKHPREMKWRISRRMSLLRLFTGQKPN